MPLTATINQPLSEHVVDVASPSGAVFVSVAVSGGTCLAVRARVYGQTGAIPATPPADSTALSSGTGIFAGSVLGAPSGTIYDEMPWFRLAAWALEWVNANTYTWVAATPTEPYGHSVSTTPTPSPPPSAIA